MQEDNDAIEKLVLIELMRLNGVILGLVLGVVFGFVIFIATIILLIKGGEPVGPHLALLGQFFIGYQVTFVGSLIGFLYGLILGFVVGFVIAGLYNWVANFREKRRSRTR
jgi:tetrahydromethanopterin S-methyltransferase subunit G